MCYFIVAYDHQLQSYHGEIPCIHADGITLYAAPSFPRLGLQQSKIGDDPTTYEPHTLYEANVLPAVRSRRTGVVAVRSSPHLPQGHAPLLTLSPFIHGVETQQPRSQVCDYLESTFLGGAYSDTPY